MKIQDRRFSLAWRRKGKCGKEEVVPQGTLSILSHKNSWNPRSRWKGELENYTLRSGQWSLPCLSLGQSLTSLFSEINPSAELHPLQQRNQSILRIAQKGSSIHDPGRSFPFVPKKFKFTAKEVGASWLSQTNVQLWEQIRPKCLRLQHTHHKNHFHCCRCKTPSHTTARIKAKLCGRGDQWLQVYPLSNFTSTIQTSFGKNHPT